MKHDSRIIDNERETKSESAQAVQINRRDVERYEPTKKMKIINDNPIEKKIQRQKKASGGGLLSEAIKRRGKSATDESCETCNKNNNQRGKQTAKTKNSAS